MKQDHLKYLAFAAMVIDHLSIIYDWEFGRVIGRLSFIIFAFLLVEGYVHTHSFTKYIWRLLVFALIAQLPYFYLFQFPQLNILFSFASYLILLKMYDLITARRGKWTGLFLTGLTAIIIFHYLPFDYSLFGFLLTLIFYIKRNTQIMYLYQAILIIAYAISNNVLNMFIGGVPHIFMLGGLWLIYIYHKIHNSERRVSRSFIARYFFYIAYPLHLYILLMVKFLANK